MSGYVIFHGENILGCSLPWGLRIKQIFFCWMRLVWKWKAGILERVFEICTGGLEGVPPPPVSGSFPLCWKNIFCFVISQMAFPILSYMFIGTAVCFGGIMYAAGMCLGCVLLPGMAYIWKWC